VVTPEAFQIFVLLGDAELCDWHFGILGGFRRTSFFNSVSQRFIRNIFHKLKLHQQSTSYASSSSQCLHEDL